MDPISLSGLLIELITNTIGKSGEEGTSFGLRRLRSLLEQEDIKSGKSPLSEIDQLLRISYFQSMSLILDECRQVLSDLLEGKMNAYQVNDKFGVDVKEIPNKEYLQAEIENVKQRRAEIEGEIKKLQPKPVIKKAAEIVISKLKSDSESEKNITLEVINTLTMLAPRALSVANQSQSDEIALTSPLGNEEVIQIVATAFPNKSLTRSLLEVWTFHQKKLGHYGGAFFAFHLKNNPVLMNLLQTHFIMRINADVIEIKSMLREQLGSDTLSLIHNYLASYSTKKAANSVYDYDVHALPITLKPGNFKLIGQATLHLLPERCLAVHGRPACGKTTLVKRILDTTNIDSLYIPIEIPLSDRIELPTIREIIKSTLKLKNDNAFESLEGSRRLLIILDGLNEVRDIYGVSRQLSFLAEKLENSRFLVTCRSHQLKNEASLYGFKEYEIQPLSLEDQINFIETNIPEIDKRKRLRKIFEEQQHLRAMCSNQFIFFMSISVLSESQLYAEKVSEFYSKFLHWFLLRWERSKGIERMRAVLENIAYLMVRSSSAKTYLEESTVDELWNGEQKVCTKEEFDFLLRSGFIEKRGKAYRLFQETFQEYLLASWLVRNGVFPIHLTETSPGKWTYKNEFELSELMHRSYIELSGIQDFMKRVN